MKDVFVFLLTTICVLILSYVFTFVVDGDLNPRLWSGCSRVFFGILILWIASTLEKKD